MNYIVPCPPVVHRPGGFFSFLFFHFHFFFFTLLLLLIFFFQYKKKIIFIYFMRDLLISERYANMSAI